MSAHDVRTLGACSVCGEVGSYDLDVALNAGLLPLLVTERRVDAIGRTRLRRGAHARCLLGEDDDLSKIMALPDEEVGKVRMNDVPKRVLDQLLSKWKPKASVR